MNQNSNEIGGIRRMLREIADMAENATLTGGLSGGAPRAVQRYNAILRQLTAADSVPTGMFDELNMETTDFSQLAVDARLLASYLKGQGENNGGDASMLIRLAPFVNREDLEKLVRDQVSAGVQISSSVITALAPFLSADHLGRLIRENLGTAGAGSNVGPSSTPPTPTPPTPEPPRQETLAELAEMLSRPELSREERARIAAKLSEMSRS